MEEGGAEGLEGGVVLAGGLGGNDRLPIGALEKDLLGEEKATKEGIRKGRVRRRRRVRVKRGGSVRVRRGRVRACTCNVCR